MVTVSYGDRMGFLSRQAELLAGEAAVREWIVVANGNAGLVRSAGLKRVPRIVELTSNGGSAVGFAAGCRRRWTIRAMRGCCCSMMTTCRGRG